MRVEYRSGASRTIGRIMNSPDRKPARARLRTRLSAPFGPPPLIDGENSAEYEELLGRVSATVKPADILEEIWVRDIVDLVGSVATAPPEGRAHAGQSPPGR